ncbi:MAG: hypothetical protein SGILL_006244 [Bacillariaceae sp.]
MRAALGLSGVSPMEEALYRQMQAEKQREFELQQMLVRERLAQSSRLESLRQEQQLQVIGDRLQEFPDLQQRYSQILMGDRATGEQALLTTPMIAQVAAEEELRRRRLLVARGLGPDGKPPRESQNIPTVTAETFFRDIAADSLSGNAIRRGDVDRRKFAQGDLDSAPAASKKRPRSDTFGSAESASKPPAASASKPPAPIVKNRRPKNGATMYKYQMAKPKGAKKSPPPKKKKAKKIKAPKSPRKSAPPPPVPAPFPTALPESETARPKKAHPHAQGAPHLPPLFSVPPLDTSFMAVPPLDPQVAAHIAAKHRLPPLLRTANLPPIPKGHYIHNPVKVFAKVLGTIGDLIEAADTDGKNGDAAKALLNFKSTEPVEVPDLDENFLRSPPGLPDGGVEVMRLQGFVSSLPKLPEEPSFDMSPPPKKKHKGLLDDDSVPDHSMWNQHGTPTYPKKTKAQLEKTTQQEFMHLPYNIDTWWPRSIDVVEERKKKANNAYEEVAEEDTAVLGKDSKFRVNVDKVKAKLSREVQPGVLEKIPHCKIHRMLLQRRKSSAPELVYCYQVTELYPNDLMVCCSHCGTWRHTACGGHHKPYSIREATEKPFVPVCDRCHEEGKILADHPVGKKRLERQRCEQNRRGLSTSAAIRQAAFSKHNGTYKWPLGSVSSSHIGGHTRSVHNRHDKAEKQWTEMATKLSKGYEKSTNIKIKHRTKELERLLQSVEDAESTTDRHNMLVYLMNDTKHDKPAGYEEEQLNIFDPADDINKYQTAFEDEENLQDDNQGETNIVHQESRETCRRSNCNNKARFDSAFCSDACGVACMQNDLLRTFSYASDMHPSTLRH